MGDLFIFINSYVLLTVGLFKDDQVQNHNHYVGDSSYMDTTIGTIAGNTNYFPKMFPYKAGATIFAHEISQGRHGTVTRGKRKGVKYIIKVL